MADQIKMKVPEIRFKSFSEGWEEKPIREVLTEKKRPIELEDNELYELVTVRRRNAGVVSRGYLQGKDILVKNYSQLGAGDFIISKRQVVHGATGIVPQHLDKAIVSNEYMVAVGNENISSEFLTVISTLPDMYRKFFLSSYGVDIEKLFFDAADWKKRNVVIPKLPEQNEICSYFAELDQMIGLHQRRYEKLVTLKKAMFKKMFPQNGATTPEIRFKGFTEPWEEKTLGEIADIYQPKTISQQVLTETGFVVYGANGIIGRYSNYNHDTAQIAVTCRGNTCGTVNFTEPMSWITGNAMVVNIDGNDLIDKRFLYCQLSFQDLNYLITGSGQPQITGTIKSHRIHLPCLEEQQKIGAYFRQLDELIAQHGTQMEKLKQIKAACLEKMFFKTTDCRRNDPL